MGDDETQRLWSAVGELVERLPGTSVVIGGLMVQLHVIEHGTTDVRPTQDIDVLGQARPAGALPSIDAALRKDGFELADPDLGATGSATSGMGSSSTCWRRTGSNRLRASEAASPLSACQAVRRRSADRRPSL